MNENSLALELLKQVKSNSRKWFIAFITTLILFFISNLVWLYAWTMPSDSYSTYDEETYDVDAGDGGNAVYNDEGEVNIDGKN